MPNDQDGYTRDPLLRSFGAVLRAHREAAGLSRARLAQALGCQAGWIEKLETAQKPPSEQTAEDLDVFFETSARAFWHMWREIKREGKHLAAPPGFSRYTEIETGCVAMRSFEASTVPGLLQTPAYARAVMSSGLPLDALEERVAARMARQELLTRDNAPRMWFVLDESALRRPVGGPKVMDEQLTKLIEAATTNPRVEIRVLPFTSVTYAALDGSFKVLSLPGGVDLAYHEGPEISHLIENGTAVAEYRVRFDLVMGESLPTEDSHKTIKRIQESYT
ncbi:helix-turn-helix domain-containing protein [Actinomadura sp. NAK00032]|uniref:helix-turn-helix domain-containing protein n=1 Tax=Actinomadura sp. NAK00032 TaxID=2742128 RepID=UPI001590E65E|nr:helix-turn-helix transcriptional regulator [Actinomadura sp. NAK00032]QKW39066.1 helix-turn-helix domain-containing protein [Actinomadura sp. NAK00032]